MWLTLGSPVVAAVVLIATAAYGADPPPLTPGSGDGLGSTRCSNVPSAACTVYAGTPGSAPVPRTAPARPAAPRRSSGAGEPVVSAAVSCSYVRSDFQPPPGGVVMTAWRRPLEGAGIVALRVGVAASPPSSLPDAGSGSGAWYEWRCTGSGARDGLFRPPVWIADRRSRAAGPSVAQLAQLAQRQLRLGAPVIAASPAGEQLVNLPTWLWLVGQWAPVTATAAVPGVSVTARATPTSVVWRMGDGTQVVCRGPGTAFRAGADAAAGSPDCGYTYRHSSAGQPGQVYAVTATVTWTVTWAGAGAAGTFPGLTTAGVAAFRVAESQSVNGTN